MAIFGPEFNKELEQESAARKELVGQTEAMEKKIEATTSAISEYNQKIQENQKAMEGMSKQQILQSNIVQEINALEEDRGELLKQRGEEREEKAGLEQLTPTFKDMQESLFNISDAELEKRQVFDKQVKQQEEMLAEMRRTNPEAEQEIAKEEANIQKMKDKEKARRENQQLGIFKRGFKGVQAGISGLGKALSKLPTSAKLGLSIAAYFALAAFLKSDMFKRFAKFIQDDLIPAIKKVFNFLMQPGGVFDNVVSAFKNIGELFLGVYKFIQGLLRGDSGIIKEGINLLIDGFFDLIEDIVEIVLGFFGFTPEETAKIMEPISKFFDDFTGYLKFMFNNIIDGIAYLFSGDIIDDITTLVSDTISNIGKFFTDMIDSGILFLKAFGAGVVAGIKALAPFGESPEDAFARAFKQTMAKGEEPDINQIQEGFRANQISAAGYDLTKIDKSPDTIIANKEKPQVSKNTVINNNNVVQQGDNVQANYSQRYVKDQESSFANAM